MSAFADRLRGVIRPARDGSAAPAVRPVDDSTQALARSMDREMAAEVLGGEWQEAAGQRLLVVERVYRPGHRHGNVVLADALPPSDGPWPGLAFLTGRAGPARSVSAEGPVTGPVPPHGADPACGGAGIGARSGPGTLFLDLETTGLAGGAGTCAFLVGCAWFDRGVLRVRQLFLSSIAAERSLLHAVADLAATAGTVVTYNGKSFDLPLIDTRFLFHRMETPFTGMPHLDLLHPARRLWRPEPDGLAADDPGAEGASCRLTTIERTLCGFVREGDVPGFEIPSRYFDYVRTGDARPLDAVFEHNRLDLVSLALLTARAAQLVEDGPEAARTPREALGLGRLYERGGRLEEALACYRRAAEAAPEPGPEAPALHLRSPAFPGSAGPSRRASGASPASAVSPAALRAAAVLCRRLRRHEEAAAAWRRLLDLHACPSQLAREAAAALAVHHEHRLRDPRTARALALRSLAQPAGPAWRQALQHRLARLDRKMGIKNPAAEPLF